MEQQGTFDFNPQLGVNCVNSGISCTATQGDTPGDYLAPRVARDKIVFFFYIYDAYVAGKIRCQVKAGFPKFSIKCLKKVWLENWDLDFLLYSYLTHVQHPIRTIVILREICPAIFHFVGFMQSLPMRELPTSAFVVYHNFHLITLAIVAKYPILLLIGDRFYKP